MQAFGAEAKPGKAEEYIRRPNPIRPDLAATVKAQGVSNHSPVYHAGPRQLFDILDIADEERWNEIARIKVCQRWWQ